VKELDVDVIRSTGNYHNAAEPTNLVNSGRLLFYAVEEERPISGHETRLKIPQETCKRSRVRIQSPSLIGIRLETLQTMFTGYQGEES
jgi:hypothetical protein